MEVRLVEVLVKINKQKNNPASNSSSLNSSPLEGRLVEVLVKIYKQKNNPCKQLKQFEFLPSGGEVRRGL